MVNFAFSKESQEEEEEEEEEARSARESASFVSLLLFRYRALRSPSFYKLKKNQNGQSKHATIGLRERGPAALLGAFPLSRGTKNCATLANCGKEVNITRARRAHQAVENLRNESRAQKSSFAS